MNKIINFLMAVIATSTILSCNSTPKKTGSEEQTKEKTTIAVKVPEFNADSAYNYVLKQVAFGPRVTNSPANEKCAVFLTNMLKSWCEDVTVQKGTAKAYNGAILTFRNIIASFNPGSND